MVYQPKNPIGYKQLFTWKQAGQIIIKVKEFVKKRLSDYNDRRLINHLIDSSRSVQRNIEEGFKRATTKEYVEFLGFSRGSLEELKGDFEELKRELKEGIRVDKGEIRGNKGEIRENGAGIQMLGDVEELLTLIYGEDCMLGRQIKSLESKMIKEKTLPHSEIIRRSWKQASLSDDRFWKEAEKRFGIKKNEKGMIIREDKGKEGKDEGK